MERLLTCTLTIHGLLHLAQGIRDCGPVWTTWTFSMERFCGMLQHNLHSRVHPWSNLNKNLLYSIYREQLAVLYDVAEELCQFDDHYDHGPIGYERTIDGCRWRYMHIYFVNFFDSSESRSQSYIAPSIQTDQECRRGPAVEDRCIHNSSSGWTCCWHGASATNPELLHWEVSHQEQWWHLSNTGGVPKIRYFSKKKLLC